MTIKTQPKRDWRDELADMIHGAAVAAKHEAQQAAMSGDCREMTLYYRDSTQHSSGALLVTRAEEIPEGFEDSGARLACNIPYSEYYRWIEQRVGRLPIITVS